MSTTRTILICSGKGGVGKTTTTANLGIALARQGAKTVVLDADFGLRNLDSAPGPGEPHRLHRSGGAGRDLPAGASPGEAQAGAQSGPTPCGQPSDARVAQAQGHAGHRYSAGTPVRLRVDRLPGRHRRRLQECRGSSEGSDRDHDSGSVRSQGCRSCDRDCSTPMGCHLCNSC